MKHRLVLILPTYLAAYALCYLAAFQLRFDFEVTERTWDLIGASLPLVLAVKCTACLLSGEWRRTFRYVTFTDLFYLVASATGAATAIYLLNFGALFDRSFPRSVILIDLLLTILAVGMLRAGLRAFDEHIRPAFGKRKKLRTLIYGVNPASISISRTLQATASETRNYRVVGFIDDDPKKIDSLIGGIRVYSSRNDWGKLARKLRAKHLLIPSSVPGKAVRQILKDCAAANLKVNVIPAVHEIVDGRYKLGIRDVTISDLLRREPAQLDMAAIHQYVSGQRVLVTGAAGSIGSELCRQILALRPASLVLVDQSEIGVFTMEQEFAQRKSGDTDVHFVIADVVNDATMSAVLQEYRPQLIFHAAAYKHVPLMEDNPQEAIRNNIFGTKNLVDLADRHNIERFVMISTDKAVRPTSVMGATKLVAEKYLQAVSAQSKTRYITVRFGNVLNSVGSVVPTFRRQIQAGGPVTVTHPDMERFFMMIPEAVQLVLQAGAIGASGEVLILEMGEPVKILDLAKDMILLSGFRYPDDIDIVFTGLRPGEKLYEELFYSSEKGAKKVHEKIYSGTAHAMQLSQVQHDLTELAAACELSKAQTADKLRNLVSAYVAAEESDSAYKKAA
jgi:FlaA1/EpsC-like NDP-sugar epimerase